MSTVIDQNLRSLAVQPLKSLGGSAAANDDHLPNTSIANGSQAVAREAAATTGGWDAHEVWRRLIKEARDRREATGNLPQ